MTLAAKSGQGRRAAVVKVQIAKRELQLDDGTYRALLQRVTGETSSTACTDAQLDRVLDELKAKGWKAWPGGQKAGKPERRKSRPASTPLAKKARALWISLHQLGEVRDPSEAALEAFGKRQLGVDKLQWAQASQANRLIEALKAMAERAGWSQDLTGVPAEAHVAVLVIRLEAAITLKRQGRG